MSHHSSAYETAISEYRQRVRIVALTALPALVLAVWFQLEWKGSLGTIFLAFISAGWALSYQRWQRSFWKKLEIKHGLIETTLSHGTDAADD